MTVMINRFLFGWVALNTKAGLRAAIENRYTGAIFVALLFAAMNPRGELSKKMGPPTAPLSLSENRNRLTAHTCDVRFRG